MPQRQRRVSYTITLYRFGGDTATLVTVLEEQDRCWIGRRVRLTGGEAAVETFAKGDWSRQPTSTTPARPRPLAHLPYSAVRLP